MEATTVPKKRGRPKKAATAIESDLPGETSRRLKSTKATSSSNKTTNASVKATKANSTSSGATKTITPDKSAVKQSKILQELAGLNSSPTLTLEPGAKTVPKSARSKKVPAATTTVAAKNVKIPVIPTNSPPKVAKPVSVNVNAPVPPSPVKPATPTVPPTDQALPPKPPLANAPPTVKPLEPPTATTNQYVGATSTVTGQTGDATKMPPRIGAGQYPKNYKSVSRRLTIAMIAMPVVIVSSYFMYDRVVLGNEPRLPFKKKEPEVLVEKEAI